MWEYENVMIIGGSFFKRKLIYKKNFIEMAVITFDIRFGC